MGNQQLHNVIDPDEAQDAATKNYVDSQNEVFGSFLVAEATPVTVDIVTQGVQVIVTSGSNTPVAGEVLGMTFQNNQELKVITAGKYLVAWSMSFSRASGGSAREFEGGVGVGGTFSLLCAAHRVVGAGNDVGNMGGVCIHDLSADDTISLMIANEGGTEDVIVEHAGLTMKLLDDQSATFTVDHGNLVGLADIADHAYALLIDGTRALAGAWDMNNENLTNVDINSGTVDVSTVTASGLITGDELELLLSTSQNYKFIEGSFNRLALQGQDTGISSWLSLHSKDGDETDDVGLQIQGRGPPIFDGDFSVLNIFFDASDNTFRIQTDIGGSGADSDLMISSDNTVTINAVDDLELEPSSNVRSENIRDDTTAGGANMFISASSGNMQRSTSSAKYKTIDSDMTAEKASVILSLRPRKYYSLCAIAVIELKEPIGDPNKLIYRIRKPYKDFTSFEDMAVEYNIDPNNIKNAELKGDDPSKIFYGLVAEEVMTVYPEAADGEGYDINFLVAALIKHAQVQEKRIEILEKQ